MEKPGTINVVGEDKALEISRAIIKTHQYVLQNVAILTDRERGYMFNEYFPAVRDYLIIEPDVLVPMEPPRNFPSDGNILDCFPFFRDGGQPDSVTLQALPVEIVNVCVSKSQATYGQGHTWELIPVEGYTINKLTGELGFMADINTGEIMNYLNVENRFYVFVTYRSVKKQSYEVGTDGE